MFIARLSDGEGFYNCAQKRVVSVVGIDPYIWVWLDKVCIELKWVDVPLLLASAVGGEVRTGGDTGELGQTCKLALSGSLFIAPPLCYWAACHQKNKHLVVFVILILLQQQQQQSDSGKMGFIDTIYFLAAEAASRKRCCCVWFHSVFLFTSSEEALSCCCSRIHLISSMKNEFRSHRA